jgi:hypothetical protein
MHGESLDCGIDETELRCERGLLDLRHPDADMPLDQADDDLIPGDTQVTVSAPKIRQDLSATHRESVRLAHWPLGRRLQPLRPDAVIAIALGNEVGRVSIR